MAKNLKSLGYEYIIIDQGWFADSIASDFEAFVHETISVKTHYTLDQYGRLLPDPIKYPSSVNGQGFKPLAHYIHSLGLKFGVHLLKGIPWESSEKNFQIKGTACKTSTISQPTKGCDWYDGFCGVDMSRKRLRKRYFNIEAEYNSYG